MSTNLTDNDLIAAAQNGDVAAFNLLSERYREKIYRLMVRACHHPNDAEEVTQEAFLRAYEKLEQFEGRSSFIAWLGRISANMCWRVRQKNRIEAASLQETDVISDSDIPEDAMIRLELQRIIRAAVAALPEPDQSVLRLRDIEEFSGQETAERLNMTLSAVKSRLHRARKMLRARLDKDLNTT